MKKQKPPKRNGKQYRKDGDSCGLRVCGPTVIYGTKGDISFRLTEAQIAAVFAEWDRRYRANPDGFSFLFDNPKNYGPACARYFLEIVLEQWRKEHP